MEDYFTSIDRRKKHVKSKQHLLKDEANFLKLLQKELAIFKIILSKYDASKESLQQSIKIYRSFLMKLSTIKEINDIAEYLQNNPLNIDIQLLWRIHLIHPIQYQKHCKQLFNINPCKHSSFPKYIYINFSVINEERTVLEDSKDEITKENVIKLNNVFESIDFATKASAYLTWMKQIISMIQQEEHLLLNTADIVTEYQEYFEYFIESDYLLPFIPTLKQSFLWYSHCLFPKIFDKEVVDISIFDKYIDISSIIIQDYNRSNAIWHALKKYTFDPDTIQFVIKQEILISGLVNSFMRDRFGTEMHIGWIFSLIWRYIDFAFDEAAVTTSRVWSFQS